MKREALYLEVKVQPGAKKDKILGLWNGRLRLSVHAPPEKGRANEAVIEFLARCLGLRANCLALARGASSREKTIAIAGISKTELETKIRSLLP